MKLLNLCEESQNYLTDPQEIENYIRKVLLFTKGYTIDQNGHVTFRAQLDITKSVKVKRLNIKIAKCGVLVCKNSNLESLDNFPDICKNYTIQNNEYLRGEIYIKTINSGDYSFIVDNYYITSIKTNDSRLYVVSAKYPNSPGIMKLNKIEFINNNDIELTLQSYSNITSFKNIIVPSKSFDHLVILHCGIRNFKNYDYVVKKYAQFDLPNIETYSNIDKVHVIDQYLQLRLGNTLNNIINIMFNPTHDIQLVQDKFIKDNTGFNILNKYVLYDFSKRKNHIMDCAVELIDNGFEEAAEL